MSFEPAYVQLDDNGASRRFVVLHLPASQGAPIGLVVHAPAFAEEMNKARRMVALQARALANSGFAVLVPDLYGCGDSPGDFAQATWARWVRDVVDARHWLQRECLRRWPSRPAPSCALWGLRTGALLAAAAARQLQEPCQLVAWQPVLQGRGTLQQFLRLLTAGEIVGAKAAGDAGAARAALSSGEACEVAGYQLPAAVAAGMESSVFEPPPVTCKLAAFEVSARDEPSLSPALAAAATRWQTAGWQVDTQVVSGPAFWQTTEIEDAPLLINATTEYMRSAFAATREPGGKGAS